jgi:ubiquinone/menaquinone biosynthesis C-methylase UbiE
MPEPKKIVEKGYDELAEKYMRIRKLETRDVTFLNLLFERIPRGARVLELGCGSGLPLTKMMAERYIVTGVDISQNQIDLARKNVPGVEFIKQDMTNLDFPDESFEAVTSYLAILHLPREEKVELYRNIHRMLKKGGILLMSIGGDDWISQPGDELMETPMYWSQFGAEKTKAILEDIGFVILRSSIEHGYCGTQEESHLFMMAIKSQ